MLKTIKKQLAIRSYRKTLGPWLQSRYGWHANYKPQQVRNGALGTGVNLDYLCYAYVMYCTRDDFNAHHAATGETCDGHACNYDAMQAEIGAGAPVSDSGHSSEPNSDGGRFDSGESSGVSGSDGSGGGDGGD